jgi:thiamine-monophosphate kinase
MAAAQPRHLALGQGGEFDRIRAIWSRLGSRAAPAGDDCAIVEVGAERLALSVDLAVEGTHFRPGWLRPDELGWRVAMAALSDLAAVAAEPLGVLVSLGVPSEMHDAFTVELMAGVADAAQTVGAVVWGGDLVRSDRIAADVAVVGRAPRPVYRAGAAPGDEVWVTGALGAPRAALRAWEDGREPDRDARERFARPAARVREAQWLAARGVRAMLDVSDGLLGDAGHLAAASGVAIEIESKRVPVHPAAGSPDDALVSGEEYELLAALPAGFAAASEFTAAHGVALTRVGRVTPGAGVTLLDGGRPVTPPAEFRHF